MSQQGGGVCFRERRCSTLWAPEEEELRGQTVEVVQLSIQTATAAEITLDPEPDLRLYVSPTLTSIIDPLKYIYLLLLLLLFIYDLLNVFFLLKFF